MARSSRPRHGARFCLRTGEVLSPPAYEACMYSRFASKTVSYAYGTTVGTEPSLWQMGVSGRTSPSPVAFCQPQQRAEYRDLDRHGPQVVNREKYPGSRYRDPHLERHDRNC